MAKYTGLGMDFQVVTTSITNLTSVEINETGDAYDASAAGAVPNEYLPGHTGGTCTVNFYDDTAEADFDLFIPTNATASYKFAPQGIVSGGLPQYTFTGIVTSRVRGVTHNATTPVTVGIQITGAISTGVVTT